MNYQSDWYPYKDIIEKPHPISRHHRPMTMEERAAQFSTFAALTGYEAAVVETARLTDEKKELDEDEKALLNERLVIIANHLAELPEISATYFVPDDRKEGGANKIITGRLKKIDMDRHVLVMTDGRELQIEALLEIEYKNQR